MKILLTNFVITAKPTFTQRYICCQKYMYRTFSCTYYWNLSAAYLRQDVFMK